MATPSPENRLVEHISRERLAEFCSGLVKIPTVSPYSGDRNPSGEWEGQLVVEQALAELGAHTERIPCRDEHFEAAGVLAPSGRQVNRRPNIIGTFRFGTGDGPVIVLDAHMDTVGVDHYRGNPFSGEIRDGFIHGRGSSDDKQGVSIMVEALRALRESDNPYHGTVICCSVVDEECDGAGRGSLACLDHLGSIDAALVLDGSVGGIWAGCTGVITAEILVSGRAGHAALGGSVNAIEKAVSLFPAFEAFRQARGNRPGEFNLGVFQAGDHPANVPNSARLAMNIKTLLADMQAAQQTYGRANGRLVRELLENCIANEVARDAFLRTTPPELRWIKDVPATTTGPESEAFVQTVAAISTRVRGTAPKIEPLGGWGDIAHFLRAGIPAVGLGAGFPGAAHSAVEKVAIQDIVDTTTIVALTLHHYLTAKDRSHA